MRMKVLAGLSLASLLCASLLFAQALPEGPPRSMY